MPKGKIKFYKEDASDSSLEFVGEDEIDHTPQNEKLELAIGNAFDITFEFNEIDRKNLTSLSFINMSV